MNRPQRVLLALLSAAAFAAGAAPRAHALSVELRNIFNDELFPKIDFENANPREPYHVAKQYLKIGYPEVIKQEVRIYSNRATPVTSTVSVRPALFFPPPPPSGTGEEVMPLFWLETSSPVPNGPSLSAQTEPQWRRMIDISDKSFNLKKPLSRLAIFPTNESFVYLGTKLSTNAPAGTYDTSLIIEIVSQFQDAKAPSIQPPACEKIPLTSRVRFSALIEDDFDVTQATFHYRLKGAADFASAPMQLKQKADNPFQWNAVALVDAEQLQLGIYEYYYECSDGSFRSFYGSPAVPKELELISEFTEVAEPMSNDGGKLIASDCALQSGAPDLTFPAGSLPVNVMITVKKLKSSSLPPMDGRSAVTAYEFGPHGLNFNQPVPLTFSYVDDNQDGMVDESGVNETDLKIFYFDGIEWKNVGGTVDSAANKVSANITHFSVYGVFPAGLLSAGQVRPGVKIITPNGDGVNDFAQFGLSGEFEIKIIDITGRRVRLLSNNNVWDGRNDSGGIVESGVYVYQVSTRELSEKVTGTIGVAR